MDANIETHTQKYAHSHPQTHTHTHTNTHTHTHTHTQTNTQTLTKKQIVAFWVYSLHTHAWPLAEHFMLRLNKEDQNQYNSSLHRIKQGLTLVV